MDFLNKGKAMLGNQSGANTNTGAATGQPAAGNVQGGAAGNEDYGDKGMSSSSHPWR